MEETLMIFVNSITLSWLHYSFQELPMT